MLNRGAAYATTGDPNSAITEYNAAIRVDPNYAGVFVHRGITYRAKGELERAVADFDQAIRLNPKDSLAYGAAKTIDRNVSAD